MHCSVMEVHVFPHMPQFALSVFGSMQAPPHSSLPMGQTTEHVPFTHPHVPPPMGAPPSPPQAVPQVPQFATSVFRSTHALPHFDCEAPHWHVPWTHFAPMEHTVPHLPQFASSAFRSAHLPSQVVEHVEASIVGGVVPESTSIGGTTEVAQPTARAAAKSTEAKVFPMALP